MVYISKKNIEKLKEVRDHASMRNANFSKIAEVLPIQVSDVDRFIKKRTEVWLNTWVLSTLDEIIDDLTEE